MPLDDDRSCTRTDGCVRQLQIVIGPVNDVRCGMDVQIYDAIQNVFCFVSMNAPSFGRKKPAVCENRRRQADAGYYSMAIAVEEANFFTSSFGTMTLRTPSSYFALTSSGLTLPT